MFEPVCLEIFKYSLTSPKVDGILVQIIDILQKI